MKRNVGRLILTTKFSFMEQMMQGPYPFLGPRCDIRTNNGEVRLTIVGNLMHEIEDVTMIPHNANIHGQNEP